MTKEQKAVQDWMRKAKQQCPERPTLPSLKVRRLRLALIQEETGELADSYWLPRYLAIVEAADALGDLLYVVLGAAVAYGIDLEPVFWEIHRSNMSKFRKGFQIRKDGKLLKSPRYSPANLGPILEAQK